MPSTPKAATPSSGHRYCGLGKHHLREPHKTVKHESMLRFARKINPELRKSTLICGACFNSLKTIHQVKLKRAIKLQKAVVQANSVSDVSSSQPQSQSLSIISAPSTTSSSSTSLTTVNEVTSTSTAKRKRTESPDDDDDYMLSLNAVNGTRLPHIQPIPKRRPTVHLNKTAMDIYLAGTTGG
ncbi:uncharacterized protein LOC117781015 [Drosophila innubila]|uniref:uncharacterized protein LOC117781015 n=1 Tax=Drosophila innubila TaxID=198719 RepID=UPI00148C812B|nr:uncharacterized protein LOC117781015 [Drosophila innubila]